MCHLSAYAESPLTKQQNAMNAAEITDKLGLHSLRQRAWVSPQSGYPVQHANVYSTSNRPVLPPEMVFTKVWSGLRSPSARLVTTRFGVSLPLTRLSLRVIRNNRTSIPFLSTTIIGAPSELILSLQFFHKRRKGDYCTMNQATVCSLAFASHLAGGAMQALNSLFLRVVFFWGFAAVFPTSGSAILCFSMVQKLAVDGGSLVVSPELIPH